MLRSHSAVYKKQIMRSLSRRCVNRVFAPEGEILSFAQPLESIQKKAARLPLLPALLGFVGGR